MESATPVLCNRDGQHVMWWQYCIIIVIVFLGMPLIFGKYMLLGIDTSDMPYHILNAMHYKDTPMVLFTSLIGNAIGNIAGWDAIVFRRASMFIMCCTVAVGSCCVLAYIRRLASTIVITLSSMIMIGLDEFAFIFGYDMLTFLTMSILLCSLFAYLNRTSMPRLFFLAVAMAIATLIRIPNVLAAPCLAVVIALYRNNRQPLESRITRSCIFLLSTAVVASLLVLVFYGSPIDYVKSMFSISYDTHSPSQLISLYIFTGKKIICAMLICMAIYYLIGLLIKIRNRYVLVSCSIALICILFATLIVLQNIVRYQPPVVYISALYTWAILFAAKSHNRNTILQVLAIAAVAVAACAGSNAAFIKILTVACLPYLWIVSQSTRSTQSTLYLIIIGIAAMSYNFFYNLWHYPMGDVSMKEIDGATTSIPALRELRTSTTIANQLDEIYSSTTSFIKLDDYFLVCRNNHKGLIWNYVFYQQSHNQYANYSYSSSFNDTTYVNNTIELIASAPGDVTVLAVSNDDIDNSLFGIAMADMLNVVKSGDGYAIYSNRRSSLTSTQSNN